MHFIPFFHIFLHVCLFDACCMLRCFDLYLLYRSVMPTSSGKGWDEPGETVALKVIVLIQFHFQGFWSDPFPVALFTFHVNLNPQDSEFPVILLSESLIE